MRVEAGILFVLQQISEEGHTCHPRGALVERCREILKVEPEAIELALKALQTDRRVVVEPQGAAATAPSDPTKVARQGRSGAPAAKAPAGPSEASTNMDAAAGVQRQVIQRQQPKKNSRAARKQ